MAFGCSTSAILVLVIEVVVVVAKEENRLVTELSNCGQQYEKCTLAECVGVCVHH